MKTIQAMQSNSSIAEIAEADLERAKMLLEVQDFRSKFIGQILSAAYRVNTSDKGAQVLLSFSAQNRLKLKVQDLDGNILYLLRRVLEDGTPEESPGLEYSWGIPLTVNPADAIEVSYSDNNSLADCLIFLATF